MYLLTRSKGPPYLTKHTGSHVTKKERKGNSAASISYTLYRFIFSLSSEKAIAGVWGYRERHLFSFHLFFAQETGKERCVCHMGKFPRGRIVVVCRSFLGAPLSSSLARVQEEECDCD